MNLKEKLMIKLTLQQTGDAIFAPVALRKNQEIGVRLVKSGPAKIMQRIELSFVVTVWNNIVFSIDVTCININ